MHESKPNKNERRNRQIHNYIFQYYSPFTVIELVENQQRFRKNYKWWKSCMGVGMWLSVISLQEKKNKCKTCIPETKLEFKINFETFR